MAKPKSSNHEKVSLSEAFYFTETAEFAKTKRIQHLRRALRWPTRLAQEGHTAEAASFIGTALVSFGKLPKTRPVLATAFLNLGKRMLNGGDVISALYMVEQAGRLDPNRDRLRKSIGGLAHRVAQNASQHHEPARIIYGAAPIMAQMDPTLRDEAADLQVGAAFALLAESRHFTDRASLLMKGAASAAPHRSSEFLAITQKLGLKPRSP